MVLNRPEAYSKLQKEVEEAQKSGQLSEVVTYAEAQKLDYFQACLKETFRVRPAVGLGIYRHVPPEGVMIDGRYYPKGTEVSVNGWVLHRDKTIFGDDVEEFRPERWFERDAKLMTGHLYNVSTGDRHIFRQSLNGSRLTSRQFGGGSHLCIGRNLALFEMNKVLIQILREFDIKLVHPGRPLEYHSTFFVVQEGLEVYLKRRSEGKF